MVYAFMMHEGLVEYAQAFQRSIRFKKPMAMGTIVLANSGTFFRSGIYKNHEDEFFKKHPVKSTIRKANSWREKRLEKNLRRNEKPLSNTWKASTRELSLLLPPSEISPTSEALGTDHSWTKFFMEISQ